jgi:2-polyprenyl-3-methyl-5-hydroxy-6-metoxy-1,4-benzoquinol methylase
MCYCPWPLLTNGSYVHQLVQEMYKFSGADKPKRILDVGCGFGGSSRWMAAENPQAQVTGELQGKHEPDPF